MRCPSARSKRTFQPRPIRCKRSFMGSNMRESGMRHQRRIGIILCGLSVITLLCYAKYRQMLPDWWAANAGGVPYVVFWATFCFALWPRRSNVNRIVLWVLFVTCLLELGQLWNPAPLSAIRSTRIGAALIGSSFHWNDFPPYFIGALVSWLMLRRIGLTQGRQEDCDV